ncbi:MAG: class I SAM-dependent methyltransferase [Anaerolineae bacterium]|nr:class I SAM-dependent methyltransferase [Anaerolineae bacterium]
MSLFNEAAPPKLLNDILAATADANFAMASEPVVGSLLRTLAASKPRGRFLEIGTGTGVGSCWLLDGMDADSSLITMDNDAAVSAIAQRHLGSDPRISFVVGDAEQTLRELESESFDLIFADSFPGKFYARDETLRTLKIGGLYVIDDLLPQPTWNPDHQQNVDKLIAELDNSPSLRLVKLAYSSGLIVAVKITS